MITKWSSERDITQEKNLNSFLQVYQEWLSVFAPETPFDEALSKIEKLSTHPALRVRVPFVVGVLLFQIYYCSHLVVYDIRISKNTQRRRTYQKPLMNQCSLQSKKQPTHHPVHKLIPCLFIQLRILSL
jgi:hypothetical protein